MVKGRGCTYRSLRIVGALTIGSWIAASPVFAQLTPDSSLGAEGSIVRSGRVIRGLGADQIEGGAQRGVNLFHSFSQFNVGEAQRVYFANPGGVENILTRVTGSDPSRILGLLGVDGRASLFLINPRGIVFGSNARLDVAGSFVASTADRFVFGDGLQFSASNPTAAPLLMVNVRPGLQYGGQPGAIVSTGRLTAGQDLTLAAGNLTVQEQLQAGGDLTLYATDTLQVRDSAASPFVAAAGGKVLVAGDRAVDIFALNHPGSGFAAGGDVILRSAGAIAGDAHFNTSGNFRVEQPDGSLGNWFSPADPVIRAAGNVSFASYTGASLHILAAGSINAGTITINARDATSAINETVRLSNGALLPVNGGIQPTLDIRAGTVAASSPLGLTGAPSPVALALTGAPTAANITIGSITNQQPSALVFLTNQYQPGIGSGNITVGAINTSNAAGGGSVVIDSRDAITLNGAVNVASTTATTNGGNVTLLAGGALTLSPGASILSRGALGGHITLNSKSTIAINGNGNSNLSPITSDSRTPATGGKGGDVNLAAPIVTLNNAGNVLASTRGGAASGNVILNADAVSLTTSQAVTAVFAGAAGQGGEIRATTRSLSLLDQAAILAVTQGNGNAGNVTIEANNVLLVGSASQSSQIGSITSARGNAGNLSLNTGSLSVLNSGQVVTGSFGLGGAGTIAIRANNITLDGGDSSIVTGITSSIERVGSPGRGGDTSINTGQLSVVRGAQIRTSTRGTQNAGNLAIAADTVAFDGVGSAGQVSAIVSAVLTGGTGSGGDITIGARSFSFTGGAAISASTNSVTSSSTQGNAGNVSIFATESASFDGIGSSGSNTGARVETFGAGRGGRLDVTTGSLSVTNGAQLRSSTTRQGEAGSITVRANDAVLLDGAESGLFASTAPGSTGNGGRVVVTTPRLTLQDGAAISVDSQGAGSGGEILLQANSLTLRDRAVISAETASNTGGDINLQVRDVLLLRNGSQISTTAGKAQGTGDGGNIRIATGFIVAVAGENSDISANAFRGRGGQVNITAQGIFGIDFRTQLTPLSDITASSQFGVAGIVTINTPDVDPSRGLEALSAVLVDASNLVTQGCAAQTGAITNRQSEFVLVGRGGLPTSPNDTLNAPSVWQDLRPPAPTVGQNVAPKLDIAPERVVPKTSGVPVIAPGEAIVEAQGWQLEPGGQISLVTHTASPNSHLELSFMPVNCSAR